MRFAISEVVNLEIDQRIAVLIPSQVTVHHSRASLTRITVHQCISGWWTPMQEQHCMPNVWFHSFEKGICSDAVMTSTDGQ